MHTIYELDMCFNGHCSVFCFTVYLAAIAISILTEYIDYVKQELKLLFFKMQFI